MIQDITERKLADLNLRANRDRLAMIVETQRDIAMAGNDLDRVLTLIADRSMELTAADGAIVSLIEGDELVVRRGMRHRRVDARQPAAHRGVDRLPRLQEPRRAADRAQRGRSRASMPRCAPSSSDRSLIAVPLLEGDAPVASLIVVRTSETDRLGHRGTADARG